MQNRAGHGRGWRICAAFREHYFNVVRCKNFQRAGKCGFRQSVGVHPDEKGTVDALKFPVVTDCLSNRQDVPLVERHICSRSAMAGGSKHDPLSWIVRIWTKLV